MAGFREHRERLALQAAQADTLKGNNKVLAVNATQQSVEIVLQNEVNKIKALPTLAEREEYKRAIFLPKWLPLAHEYFTKGATYQNDVVGYCIMYLFDVGDFEQGITLAEQAQADGQGMPQGIVRTIPAFVADQIYNWTEKTTAKGESSEPYFSQILEKLTTQWALNEIVMAKWLKMAAQQILLSRLLNGTVKTAVVNEPVRLETAIRLAVKASRFNHKIGVKNLIERCFMRLSALEKAGVYTQEKIDSLQGELSNEELTVDFKTVKDLLNSSPLSLKDVMEANNV
ncbi:phage terminase small subunit [Mannheimia haemolytica]